MSPEINSVLNKNANEVVVRANETEPVGNVGALAQPNIVNAQVVPVKNNNVVNNALDLLRQSVGDSVQINPSINLIPEVSNAVPPIIHSPEQETHNRHVIKPLEGIGNAGSQNEINNLPSI